MYCTKLHVSFTFGFMYRVDTLLIRFRLFSGVEICTDTCTVHVSLFMIHVSYEYVYRTVPAAYSTCTVQHSAHACMPCSVSLIPLMRHEVAKLGGAVLLPGATKGGQPVIQVYPLVVGIHSNHMGTDAIVPACPAPACKEHGVESLT